MANQTTKGNSKPHGNLKPLPGVVPSTSALRHSLAAWTKAEIDGWTSVFFVTLNFQPRVQTDVGQFVRLSHQTARGEVEKFGKRVDRAAFGRNAVRRFNQRVRRIPFLEYGADRGWHCHLVMEKPARMADVRFYKILRDCWSESDWSVLPVDIRPADTELAGYLTKYRSKNELEAWTDTIVTEATVAATKYGDISYASKI